MPDIISKKILIFEFMMSVLVILVHSLSNVIFLKDFIVTYIQPISVVPFFIISGFLFFRNVNLMNDVIYKIKKRIYTLVIPYLLWNLIYYVIYVVCRKNVYFGFVGLFNAVVNYVYNPTFWFLQQLIIITILTPIIFLILREKRVAIVGFIAIGLMILIGADIPYINGDAFLYYYIGCFIAKYNKKIFYELNNKSYVGYSVILAIGLFFIHVALVRLSIYSIYIYNISVAITVCQRICVVAFLYYGFDYVFGYNKVYKFMKHNFFTYAIHHIIIRFINSILKIFYRFNVIKSLINIIPLLVFIITPIVIVIISYYLYEFLNNKFKKVLLILTGGR